MGQNIFGSKKILGPQKITGLKKICGPKILGPKIFCPRIQGGENCKSKKMLCTIIKSCIKLGQADGKSHLQGHELALCPKKHFINPPYLLSNTSKKIHDALKIFTTSLVKRQGVLNCNQISTSWSTWIKGCNQKALTHIQGLGKRCLDNQGVWVSVCMFWWRQVCVCVRMCFKE